MAMKISWGSHVDIATMKKTNGYGYATKRITDALRSLGHEVAWQDPDADLHFHFDQPHWLDVPREGMFTIMYFPWESTRLKNKWDSFLNTADELWTPSPLIAGWFKTEMKLKPPVFVFEHGVDPIWTPVERQNPEHFKFLHMGAEGARKGGYEAMRAMREEFKNEEDVSITLKMINNGWNISQIGQVSVINEPVPVEHLVQMFHEHHAYIYPSWGEGFGLTPLQAMATGMPTITVPAWAPYAKFLDPNLNIRSKPMPSPWPMLHPGYMIGPKNSDVRSRMRWVVENYDQAAEFALKQVEPIRDKYDWTRLTDEAFIRLEKRLKNR